MNTADIDKLRAASNQLKEELEELESHYSTWDASSTAGGRRLRSIAKRIVLVAKRLEAFVKENTYSPR